MSLLEAVVRWAGVAAAMLLCALSVPGYAQAPWLGPLDTAPAQIAPSGTSQSLLKKLRPFTRQCWSWALQGRLVTPNGVIPVGFITIRGSRITGVVTKLAWRDRRCLIKTDGLIVPGFIDLHNHLAWNVLPRWSPKVHFTDHIQWSGLPDDQKNKPDPDYKARMSDRFDNLMKAGLGCEANLYAEIKALAGGATSLLGSFHPDDGDFSKCIGGLARNLDFDSRLPLPAKGNCAEPSNLNSPLRVTDLLVNVVALKGKYAPSQMTVEHLRCNLQSGRLKGLMVHVAEGRPDPKSDARKEFEDPAVQAWLMSGFGIVHGTALSAAEFEKMGTVGVGLIWSPRSNLELYGVTTDVAAAKAKGVNIALGPDWSPTGSSGVLQELSYARQKFDQFSAQELTQMATSIPAQIARIDDKLGKLQEKLFADLVVLDDLRDDAFESVVVSNPRHVQLVIIAGRPLYGSSELMKKLLPNKQLDAINVCGMNKAVDLADTIIGKTGKTWAAVISSLQVAVGELGAIECDLPAVAPRPLATDKPTVEPGQFKVNPASK